MTNFSENGNDSSTGDRHRTVLDVLRDHKETLHLLEERGGKKPVSIIVLCETMTHFDEKKLGVTPHITLDLDDDLLQKIRELLEENARLRSLSLIDSLTGLFNNRFFWMQLEKEMARTKRTGHSCSLMMIDLDNFKLLNDAHGHMEGDKFLVEFGRMMRENARSTDLIYRYGGDEFALIMPVASATEARKIGERFNDALRGIPQKSDPPISLSIGISEYTPFSEWGTNEFVHTADLAMYMAKKNGKNGIRIDEASEKAATVDNEVSRDEKEALFGGYQ